MRFGKLTLAALLVCATSYAQAQSTPFYIAAGDQSLLTEVQNGALVQTVSVPGLSYPIAVGKTIWLGNRDDNGATEYTLGGVPTGNTSTGGGNFSQLLDGTTDGAHNYGLLLNTRGGTDAVTTANLDWSGQSTLFSLGTNFSAEGITFDTANKHLFISYFNGTLEERDLVGNLINSYSPGVDLASLAYEQATDTLWVAPNGGNQIVQISTTGMTLQTLTISGVSSFGNNYGGEMPLTFGPQQTPEPGSVALLIGMGLSGAGFLARRRKQARQAA